VTPEPAANVPELVQAAIARAKTMAGLRHGTRVVLTAGSSAGTSGTTNLVVLRDIG